MTGRLLHHLQHPAILDRVTDVDATRAHKSDADEPAAWPYTVVRIVLWISFAVSAYYLVKNYIDKTPGAVLPLLVGLFVVTVIAHFAIGYVQARRRGESRLEALGSTFSGTVDTFGSIFWPW
jgi:hypothetical protein